MATATFSKALVDVYLAPKSLFDYLKNAKGWTWLTLLLIITVNTAVILYFYSGLSDEWIVEQQMMSVSDISPAEEQQARSVLVETAPYSGILGAVFSALFTLITISCLAAYFKFIGRSNQHISYAGWFKFATWLQMPSIIYMLGLLVLILMAGSPELPLMMVNYGSLNQLVLGLQPSDALFTWAESVNLVMLWNIVLGAIGLTSWCKLSMAKSVLYSAFPYVFIFSIWGILA